MNKLEYTIANAPPGQEVRGFRGEYFDILSPVIKYRYSEVFWVMQVCKNWCVCFQSQEAVPIPSDIVARYNNSVMAVTGLNLLP